MNDDELMHYGKVGMKWGKRHASSGSSSAHSSAKKLIEKLGAKKLKASNEKLKAQNKKLKEANKEATKKASDNTNKDPHDVSTKGRMSDNEMKSRINRLEMEKKYASLTQKQSSQAKKMVVDILSTAFKTTAQGYVTKMMGETLSKITADKVAAAAAAASTPKAPTPKATTTASTAEPHSNSNSSFTGRVYPNAASANRSSSSNTYNNNYVYPNNRLLN